MEFMESPSPEAREDHSLSCSIARGGPMFVPNLVGPLTSVPNFESSLLQLLQDLETEISSGLVNPCDDDISVDELKVFSEEELVNMAMKEAFKDGEAADSSSQLPENQSITGGEYGQGISNGELSLGENSASKEDASTAPQCTNGFTSKATSDTALGDNARRGRKKTKNSRADGRAVGSYLRLPKNQSNSGEGLRQGISNSELFRLENSARNKDASTALECSSECTSKSTSNTTTGDGAKKRKRKTNNNQSLAVSYIAKVEEVVKIKQKQDEEKAAAAGLHSYNANKEGAVASAERAERLEIMRSTGSKVKLKPSIMLGHVPMQYPEVLLSVEVHHNSRKSNKVQEFLVLGRQMLTELRDKIYCITDHIMEKAGLYDPSGYFLIEDVFCNDLRDPSAIDYSKPILQWLVSSKEEALRKWECIVSGELQQKQKAVVGEVTNLQLPQFKAVEMQKARLCDLKFQLGAGYLYCHQGDCRHSIVIRDMRLIHPDDVQNRAAYPITTFQLKTRALKCCVCKIYRATKVTLDDKWAPENPCYFCDNCYFLLHYSKDSVLFLSFNSSHLMMNKSPDDSDSFSGYCIFLHIF